MDFHGIGRDEHGEHVHHVTKCIHEHPHYRTDEDAAKAAASAARAQGSQAAAQQGEGQLSLSAWLEKYLSKGKGMLRRFWNGSESAAAGEAGDRSGQEQVLAQISDSKEASGAAGQSADTAVTEGRQMDVSQAVHVSRASQAAAPASRAQAREVSDAAGAQEKSGQEGNLWSRMRVRFKDITGQLAGHLRGNTSKYEAKRPFQAKQKNVREEQPRREVKPGRDAVQIRTYHVEESHLLDSYDRKGEYSKISTKK